MPMMIRLEPAAEEIAAREIYIMAGQSNSAGQGVDAYPPLPYADKIKNYNCQGAWVDATEPLMTSAGATYPVQFSGLERVPQHSAGRSFANALYQLRPNREIGLVPNGKGGTGITEWAASTSTSTLYGAMRARSLAAAPAGVIKGFIWYHGESMADSMAEVNAYPAQFLAIYDAFCAHLGIPGLKCIVTGLATNDNYGVRPYWDEARAAIASLDGQRSGNIGYVNAQGLAAQSGDVLHLSTAGQVQLGILYATKMHDMLTGA